MLKQMATYLQMSLTYSTQNIIGILIPISPYSNFLQLAFDFICVVPAVVLLWLLSCILRKHIIILTPHQPSEASLVGCQWEPMCHQEWQMIIWLRSLKKSANRPASGIQNITKNKITSSHTQIIKLMF